MTFVSKQSFRVVHRLMLRGLLHVILHDEQFELLEGLIIKPAQENHALFNT